MSLGFGLLFGKLVYILVTYGFKGIIDVIKDGNGIVLLESQGIVFYGGLIGALIGVKVSEVLSHTNAKDYYTSIIPFLPLGHAIGRIGCFMAGCCYGRVCYGPLGMYFRHAVSGLSPNVPVLPTQLIESFLNVCIFLYLYKKTKNKRNDDEVLLDYIMIYSIIRFFLEFLRGDLIRGKYLFLYTSQWLSIGMICGVFFYKTFKKKKI